MILQELDQQKAIDLLQDGKTIYVQAEDLDITPGEENTFMFRRDAFPAELNFYPKYTPISRHLFTTVLEWLKKRTHNEPKFYTFNSSDLLILDRTTFEYKA
jgi:hypothetical protein